MKSNKISNHFIKGIYKNQNATLDMPLRLVVALIIATITLVSIFGLVSQSVVIPRYLHVTIDPMYSQWNETVNSSKFSIFVKDDSNQQPINNALVLLKSPFGVEYNYTNQSGRCQIQVSENIPTGINEWFLDVTVKSAGYETYHQDQMIRIIDTWEK